MRFEGPSENILRQPLVAEHSSTHALSRVLLNKGYSYEIEF
jgi:hypothetical protein